MTETAPPGPTFLVVTVGGSPEPVAAALCHWRPDRVLFLASSDTVELVQSHILPLAQGGRPEPLTRKEDTPPPAGLPTHQPFHLQPEQYGVVELSDPQNFEACVTEMRQALLASGVSRDSRLQLIADFTGGTKCMSAALSMVARSQHCKFSYVGGEARDKGGVGIVVSGREHVFRTGNPWTALGYQALEDFRLLFNHGQYAAAALLIPKKFPDGGEVRGDARPEFHACKCLAQAYAAWDRFDHKEAESQLTGALTKQAALAATFSGAADLPLEAHRLRARQLKERKDTGPSREYIEDLLANAQRRAAEQRFDDAVARLYRVVEAMAQFRLKFPHGILNTSAVSVRMIPDRLLLEWGGKTANQEEIKLGLQDAYRLLEELGDPLGARFRELAGPLPQRDAAGLAARNNSILAHGWVPVAGASFGRLQQTADALACELEITPDQLVQFPVLGELV